MFEQGSDANVTDAEAATVCDVIKSCYNRILMASHLIWYKNKPLFTSNTYHPIKIYVDETASEINC